MPYKIHKRNGHHEIVHATTGQVIDRCTTREKARAQVRHLHDLERRPRRPRRVKAVRSLVR